MSQSGPITAALEEEVARTLRQRGMVVWLDKDGHYTTYVDALVERHTRGAFFGAGSMTPLPWASQRYAGRRADARDPREDGILIWWLWSVAHSTGGRQMRAAL